MENKKVSVNDNWYQEVKNIIATNKIPSTFVGHCYEIRQNIETQKSDYMPSQPTRI